MRILTAVWDAMDWLSEERQMKPSSEPSQLDWKLFAAINVFKSKNITLVCVGQLSDASTGSVPRKHTLTIWIHYTIHHFRQIHELTVNTLIIKHWKILFITRFCLVYQWKSLIFVIKSKERKKILFYNNTNINNTHNIVYDNTIYTVYKKTLKNTIPNKCCVLFL